MKINADFSERVVIRPGDIEWTPSPMAGVERLMLDRIGEEVARATSIVRYAPSSFFSEHEHGGGEEYFVLEGIFSDEHGDYPAGTYVRNPIGSRHTPHSKDGCTIFVKLHQFDPADVIQKVIDTRTQAYSAGDAPGVSVLPLHAHGQERISLARWSPGAAMDASPVSGGEEILVLDGVLQDEFGDYPKGAWLRNPLASAVRRVSETGCLAYIKTGHLTDL